MIEVYISQALHATPPWSVRDYHSLSNPNLEFPKMASPLTSPYQPQNSTSPVYNTSKKNWCMHHKVWIWLGAKEMWGVTYTYYNTKEYIFK